MHITVRQMAERDLPEADSIFRRAFGTQFGAPDPATTFGDMDYVYNRFKFKPENTFVAECDGKVAGSVFLTHWGSVAFFGPLTVDPKLWQQGIGKALMERVVSRFDEWKVTHRCLFTFAESPKHVGLYRRFGFWPRFLTAFLSREVPSGKSGKRYRLWSQLSATERSNERERCRAVTNQVYRGLDAASEIDMIQSLSLGDTVLIDKGGSLAGFACCHVGAKTEAGSGSCYIKFAAVAPSPSSVEHFKNLMSVCEDFAANRGATRIVCGMNYGRERAMVALHDLGYRIERQGVAMHGNNEPGYALPDIFAIDDWR